MLTHPDTVRSVAKLARGRAASHSADSALGELGSAAALMHIAVDLEATASFIAKSRRGADQLGELLRQAGELADELRLDLVAAHIETARDTLETTKIGR